VNPEIDAYLARADRWRDEMAALRAIALDCGLDESLKWGKPCFCRDGRNIAIVQPFKETCAFMFFKGALLDDPDGLLEKQGAESHAARRVVFTDAAQVAALETRLRAWIGQAVKAEAEGTPLPERTATTPEPVELAEAFAATAGLEAAFRALTPGRQREYLLQINGAKKAETRRERVVRFAPRILAGKGLRD